MYRYFNGRFNGFINFYSYRAAHISPALCQKLTPFFFAKNGLLKQYLWFCVTINNCSLKYFITNKILKKHSSALYVYM